MIFSLNVFWQLVVVLIIIAFIWFFIIKRIPALSILVEGHYQLVGMGILFAVAFLWVTPWQSNLIPFAVLALTATGLADDIWDISIGFRVLIQLATAACLLTISLPVPGIVLILLAMIWMNMFNFMDGSNGIMGLTTIVSLSTFGAFQFIMLGSETFLITGRFLMALITALLIFGFGNFRNRALWMAGDTGSIVLGFTALIACLMLQTGMAMDAYWSLLLCSFSVFLTDTGWTLMQRIWQRENILTRHQQHIYQRLAGYHGMKHMQVAFLYSLMQILVFLLWVSVLVFFAGEDNDDFPFTFFTVSIFGTLSLIWFFLNRKFPYAPIQK